MAAAAGRAAADGGAHRRLEAEEEVEALWLQPGKRGKGGGERRGRGREGKKSGKEREREGEGEGAAAELPPLPAVARPLSTPRRPRRRSSCGWTASLSSTSRGARASSSTSRTPRPSRRCRTRSRGSSPCAATKPSSFSQVDPTTARRRVPPCAVPPFSSIACAPSTARPTRVGTFRRPLGLVSPAC